MTSKRFYPRACPLEVGELLRHLAATLESAGWDERGGYLLRDPDDKVIGRTKWVPRSQWWADRPDYLSERQTAGILLKFLQMKPLTKRESRCIEHLMRTAGIISDQVEVQNQEAAHGQLHAG